ncbi:MAG: electron transfer flavoprotein subunit alpha/FixB family protein [Actinomycetes bacterium]|jgi:electron transfer flavoprotein alpha subunit
MSQILVLIEHANGAVKKVSLELLTLAARHGSASAVVIGPGADNAVADLTRFGAATIYVASDAALTSSVVGPKVSVLNKLLGEHSPAAVLIASTAEGKEIAGRLAVRSSSGVITDAVDIEDGLVVVQSVFGGSTIVRSAVTTGTPIITVRPNSTTPVESSGAGEVVTVSVELAANDTSAVIAEHVVEAKGGRPDLAEAATVVSGGRGVGSAEGFELVEKLADCLDAAVGASRAATDSGFYPHQYQVGQTGKTVSPQLYIALGISGAIQHRAGMQTSKTIVAVNKDAEAPIFELADFGVVGDLFNVAPQLTQEITSRKG